MKYAPKTPFSKKIRNSYGVMRVVVVVVVAVMTQRLKNVVIVGHDDMMH